MSMDNLSAETRTAITTGSRAAQSLEHRQVHPAHLLIGLFAVPESTPARVLMGYGLMPQTVESRLAALCPPGSIPANGTLFAPAARAIISAAQRECLERGSRTLDINVFARAIVDSGDPMVATLLEAAQVSPQTVLAAFDAAMPAPDVTAAAAGEPPVLEPAGGPSMAATTPAAPLTGVAPGKALSTFGVDLLAQAREGRLDPVTGRDAELGRLMVTLARRLKNNPVLVGEPGVGKSAVIEALAQRIVDGDVPEFLVNRPLISVDLAAMVAGARYRGDFEERLKQALKEAQACEAILFIDEIHQVVGAGAAAGGTDVANILKPYIARGEVTLVGATTLEEYRKHIEADAALERRFQKIVVGEPTVPDTVRILTSLRPQYAAHHRVAITDDALSAAATLSARYITDRFLPDKAIDVLDEAGAAAAMAQSRTDEGVRALYAQRAEVRAKAAEAVTASQLATAAELAGTDAALTADILAATGEDLAVIDAGHIATVVAAMTGVPVTAIGEVEAQRLKDQPARLGGRVIGQGAAVETVCRAVRRVRQGLSAGTRPTSFIFAGPTGVGKTELAKALADDLFGADAAGRGAFIHLDMSEYAERSSVARLFGAPPGYVGHDAGGQLTEKVRRSPYSVILLDEVEKAHVEVFDALLAVLEDGRMTDGTGRTVNFANTIIVMTTNLGSAAAARAPLGFGATDPGAASTAAARRAHDALKAHFRPEFLNRIDDVVVFSPLERADLDRIVTNLLAPTREQLAARGVDLELSTAAVSALLEAGYDPAMGARPLRRAITRMLVDPLSEALLSGALPPGTVARVDVTSGTAVLTVRADVAAPAPVADPVPAA